MTLVVRLLDHPSKPPMVHVLRAGEHTSERWFSYCGMTEHGAAFFEDDSAVVDERNIPSSAVWCKTCSKRAA